MANCIAIDTSSEACSVSLVVEGEFFDASISAPKSHAKSLLPFIDGLLSARRIGLADLDFIACTAGPGSFTGLRIGLGVAQGLAFGAGKPMVAVSSLDALARAARMRQPQAEVIVSLLDARMGEIYWAVTEFSPEAPALVVEPSLNAIGDVNTRLAQLAKSSSGKSLLLAGAAASLLDCTALQQEGATFDDGVVPSATQIAVIALELWREGVSCRAQDFQLNYLRNSVSWNKRQRIRT